ncbi:MAG TPA: DivIVA domain-containing protein [Egibacteraceae bacterium]|jgi:cell division initiation protein|nr:DivIVA domain-containing protein [Egibacteraceae bacterium]
MTPDDIERQVFKERFRGYDQDEVDRFLDRVSTRIEELTRERDALAEKVGALERQTEEAGESGSLLQRTLLAAQRTADETVAEAREQAERTLEEARREAHEIIADAEQRAGEHERRAQEVLDHVRRAVEDLSRFRSEYRERVEAVIAEQLAMLDRAGDLPEIPDGLAALAHVDTPAGTDAEEVGRVYWEHGPET